MYAWFKQRKDIHADLFEWLLVLSNLNIELVQNEFS